MQLKRYTLFAIMFIVAFFSSVHAQDYDFTSTNITCNGANDGTITATVTGGSSTYLYVYYLIINPNDSTAYGPTSALSHTFNSVKPGTWVAYVKDLVAGTTDYDIVTIEDQDPIVSSFTPTPVNCFGASTGRITFTPATGGSGNFDYTINGTDWHNGQINFNSLPSGNYFIAIRDHDNPGCVLVLDANYHLPQNDQLNASLTYSHPTCYNSTNGSITISSPEGGTGSYQYTITGSAPWSAAATGGRTYPNLPKGTYNVVMRDAGVTGCTRTLDGALVLDDPDQLTVNISINKGLTCFEGSDGRLQADVTGGTGPYTYSWAKWVAGVPTPIGQTGPIATNLNQARYDVTVNDARGCGPRTATIFFIYGPAFAKDSIPPMFYYDGAVATTTCEGQSNGSIDMSAHGGVKPYRFSITTGGGSGYQADSLFTNVGGGTYQPWVVDDRGCKKTGADVVVGTTPNSPVSVTITPSVAGSFCPGTSVTFTANPVNGGTNPVYQWRLNGNPVGANQNTYTNATLANNDQVTVTLTSDIRCTSGNPATSAPYIASVLVPVTINTHPVSQTLCAGSNVTFTVAATGSSLSYQWLKNGVNIGTNSPSLTLNNITTTDAGTYTVRVSNACGTVTSNAAVLTVHTVPAISDQPDNATVCSGGTATFSVTATGGNLTYEWRRNGTAVGTNSPTLTLNGVTPAMAGNYTVYISNSCGNVTSAVAVLTVNTAPAISDQPDPVTVCSGGNATFSVTASGGDLTYQWRRNGVNVGTNSPTLSLTGVTPAMAGNYTVYISNSCGNITSSIAVLTVNTIPAITSQPTSITVCSGGTANFSVTATGGDLTYQWRRNGVNVGTNSPTLSLTGVTPAMAGDYTVYISNSCGNVTSAVAVLTVNTAPAINDQPDNVTVCAGGNATFTVSATGGDLTYQWRRNGVNVGGNSPTLNLTGVTPAMAGNYTVYISNSCGNITSAIAVLTVHTVPVITNQPDNATVCAGDNVDFSVEATGGDLTYQWRHNGTNVGGNSPTLSLSGVTPAMAGDYTVYISNTCGNVTSSTAVLTVNTAPAITTQPVNATVCSGGTATFQVIATGGNLTYQWRRNGVNVGSNSPTLTLTPVTPAMAGNYDVYISNSCGNITSATVVLTVNTVPVITDAPDNLTVCSGDNATFSVTATGGDLSYEWRRNGVAVPGGTSATLNLAGVTPAMAGNYTVYISNTCGNVTSAAAVLVVNTVPAITTQPEAKTVCSGSNTSFSVVATGGNLTYQWRRNGVNVGSNSPTLNLTAVTPAMAGNYDVYISNNCGNVTSVTVALTVNTVPVITDAPDNLTVCSGDNAIFSVTATGGDLSYEWRRNGVAVPGGTSATLNLAGVTPAMAGNYTVYISNTCGNVTSAAAVLVVNTIPAITTQPEAKTVCSGSNTSLSVVATGGNLTYQWRHNGVNVGSNSPTLSLTAVTPAMAGNYDVYITNNCGNVTSVTVAVTVNTTPAVTDAPDNLTVCAGDNATFSVTATGGDLSYEWRRNGVAVPGGNSATLTLISVTPAIAGNYTVYVSNNCGNILSAAAVLTVNTVPVITDEPDSRSACQGDDITFNVTATGGDLTYVWRHDGTIVGTNAPALALNDVTTVMEGNYTVTISNTCGTVTSVPVSLVVNNTPVIITDPVDVTVCEGDNALFSVDATGLNLTYQWLRNGSPLTDENAGTLSINAVTPANAGIYTVIVTNECGIVTSAGAELIVNTAPVITLQPVAVDECAGSTITFTANASGVSNTVTWRRNGFPIPGETNTQLIINNINAGHAGSYDAVFTNACGTTTTNAVTLTVAEPPVIVDHPTGTTLCEGGNFDMGVDATGSDLTYQWRKDGTPIAGETGAVINLTDITMADAGNYTVAVYGRCDTVISNVAVLNVNPATTADIIENDTIVCAGSNVEFNVVSDGFGMLTYQWQLYFNNAWVDISDNEKYTGTNSFQFTINDAQAADSGLYRVQVSGGCGTVNSEPVRFDVNVMVVSIGTPAPFMINSTTTDIEVSLRVTNHFLIFDMGFSLVAPDGTEVMLKYPMLDACVYNSPVNVNAVFNNSLPASDSMDYCLATGNITGTFGAVGDWSVLNGMDPSNGAWQIRVYDQNRAVADPDGYLTSATLRFTDLDYDGDTAIVSYNSGAINEGIINPIASEMRPTSYIVPIRLMTSCFNTEDARAVVTVDGGVAPFTYEWSGPTAEDGVAQVDLGPGTYTVTVTDYIGCTAQASVEVTSPPAIVYEDVQHTDTIACFDAPEGIIRAKATGGSGGFTYTLMPGNIPSSVADSGVFTGLTAGAYTIRVTDINDCSFDTIIHIYQRPALVVDIATVPVVGNNKGSITLLASGGLPPYMYSIDNGTTMQDSGQFTGLDAGIYNIYVIDSAGCIFTDVVNLNVDMLNLSVTIHDVSCAGLADGNFYIALTDGVGPYMLTGPFTDTLTVADGFFSFTNQAAGSYEVKIEDNEGSVFMDTVHINEPDAILATETITRPECPNSTDGAIELDVTGGTGALTFEWNDGTTTEDRTNITEGFYQVTITDEEDCYADFDYMVNALDGIEAIAGPDQVLCPGDTAELFAVDADSVHWSYIGVVGYDWISDVNSNTPRVFSEQDVTMLYTVFSGECYDTDTLEIDIDGPYGVFIARDPEAPGYDTTAFLLEGETIRLTTFYDTTMFSGHEWIPAQFISYPFAPLTYVADVSPQASSIYSVRAITNFGCVEYGRIRLIVASNIEIFNAFSPNGDGRNDTWTIRNAEAYGDKITVKVFNRWGEPIFESHGYGGTNQWDGTRNGKMMPVGSYYYIITIKDGKSEPFTGTVTLLR